MNPNANLQDVDTKASLGAFRHAYISAKSTFVIGNKLREIADHWFRIDQADDFNGVFYAGGR